MTYLLTRHYSTFYLYSPDTYGMETWGSNDQDGIEKRGKSWYITSWRAGNEWLDDYEEEFKLNVVVETSNLSEVIRYVEEHNPKEIKKIVDMAKEIIDNKLSFDSWFDKVIKNR